MGTEKPRLMAPEEKGKVLETLRAAFYDDPLCVHLLPSTKARDRWLGFGLEALFALDSQPWIQVLDDCAGAIAAYPPGPSDGGLFAGLADYLGKLPSGRVAGAAVRATVSKLLKKADTSAPSGSGRGSVLKSVLGVASRMEIAGVPGGALVGFLRLLAAMETREIAEPHYYVLFLAVHPDRRGRGLARRLLGGVLAEADKAGVPCYGDATSVESLRFCEHMGFEVRQELRPLGDGPPMWLVAHPYGG